jgi:hypothetical protein
VARSLVACYALNTRRGFVGLFLKVETIFSKKWGAQKSSIFANNFRRKLGSQKFPIFA